MNKKGLKDKWAGKLFQTEASPIFLSNVKAGRALKIAKYFFFIFSHACFEKPVLLVTKCHLKLNFYEIDRLFNPRANFSGLT
jgi:hypothetical protein